MTAFRITYTLSGDLEEHVDAATPEQAQAYAHQSAHLLETLVTVDGHRINLIVTAFAVHPDDE